MPQDEELRLEQAEQRRLSLKRQLQEQALRKRAEASERQRLSPTALDHLSKSSTPARRPLRRALGDAGPRRRARAEAATAIPYAAPGAVSSTEPAGIVQLPLRDVPAKTEASQ
jgi:hypothetical protein